MNQAYTQYELAEHSRPLTAFETSDGVYQYKRLYFGLKTAPLAFQRLMHLVLGGAGALHDHILLYLDDLCLHTPTAQQHLHVLRQVFQKFADAGITLKKSKCHFFMETVEYLGFKLSSTGVSPGDKGLFAIHNYPLPRSCDEIHSFLGLCGYFDRFIPVFADITLPLRLVVNRQKYQWGTIEQHAFDKLKAKLTTEPVLKYPDFSDTAPPLIVQTDASMTGLSGVLLQADQNGMEHPVCYASKLLSKTERNYSTIHREALAIIWSVRKFREYLFGRRFIIRTDHKPLTFIDTCKSPKFARWSLELAEYPHDIEFVCGKDNIPSDVLSRAPIEDNEVALPLFAVTRGQEKRNDIIQRSHDLGHFGANRTLELAQMVDPKITLKQVKDYISQCKDCLVGPHVIPKAPVSVTSTATRPWQVVHCDFVGPLARSSAGYEYIFTYKDDLTRFVIAWPMRSATADTAISIMDRLFSILGPPSTLHSDNGSVFTSDLFRTYAKSKNILQSFTPIARPQANPVERSHRTLKTSMLKTAETESQWDLVLPQIVLAHNSVPNRTTGIPPYFAMFGRSSPVTRLLDVPNSSEGEEESDDSDIEPGMGVLWQLIYERQKCAKEKRCEKLLSGTCANREFSVGDTVALKVIQGPKFCKHHFARGFKVERIYGHFLVVTKATRKCMVSKDLVIPDNLPDAGL